MPSKQGVICVVHLVTFLAEICAVRCTEDGSGLLLAEVAQGNWYIDVHWCELNLEKKHRKRLVARVFEANQIPEGSAFRRV